MVLWVEYEDNQLGTFGAFLGEQQRNENERLGHLGPSTDIDCGQPEYSQLRSGQTHLGITWQTE